MKKRVLLAEDDIGNMDVMRAELDALGYEVTIAKNGLEAVEMATSNPPDLIVMDILMPRMDGFQAVSRIKQNPKTKAIPILAATCLAEPADEQKCFKIGCDGYIAKPFTYKELGAAIAKLLRVSSPD